MSGLKKQNKKFFPHLGPNSMYGIFLSVFRDILELFIYFHRCVLSFTVVVLLLRFMICCWVLWFRATVQYGGYKCPIKIIRVADAPRNVFRYHFKHHCMTTESSFALSFVRFGESSSTEPKTNNFWQRCQSQLATTSSWVFQRSHVGEKRDRKRCRKSFPPLRGPERHQGYGLRI